MMKSGSVRLASASGKEPTYATWWDQAHIKTLGMEGCIPIHLIRCLRKYDRGQIGWDRFAAHRIHCFNITNLHRGFRSCVVGPTTSFGHGCNLSHFVPGPFFLRSSSDLQFFEAQDPELAALTRHAWKTTRHSVIVCLCGFLAATVAMIAVPQYSQSMPHSCHFPSFVLWLTWTV
jgi:hypothetical protein